MWNTAASILCSSSSSACSSSLSSSSRTAANILIRAHSNIQRQNYSCSRHSKAKPHYHHHHHTQSFPQSQISIAILASIAVSTGVCVVSDSSKATLADDSGGAGADSSTTTTKKKSNNKTSSSSQFRSRKLTTVIHPKKKYGSFATGGDKVKKKKGTENAQLALVARQKIIYPTELEYVATDDDDDDDDINNGFNGIKKKKKKKKSIKSTEDKEVNASVEDLMIGSHTCHGIEPSSYHHLIDPITETLNLFTSKINQDRGCVVLNYCPMPVPKNKKPTVNHHLFAVFDGHGDGGEFISEFVMNELIRLLGKHPDFDSTPKKALIETFLQIEDNIENDPFLEALYCGTTACVVLVRQNVLYIANIGDSRAILSRGMRRNKQADLPLYTPTASTRQTIELTQDQKPNLQSEKERIENEYGGYVSPGNSNTGIPARVWSSVDKRDLGLAMSRSLGDLSLKKSGVIATPVVSSYKLHGDEEFLVIASDGLWEYMDSEEVVDLVATASTTTASKTSSASEDDTSVSFSSSCNAKKASEALIKESAKRWRYYDGNYRDDITAIVIRLDKLREEQEENEKKKEGK